ncbi:MAG: polyprenyl diphosphate synthase [Halobacteriales archaeon]
MLAGALQAVVERGYERLLQAEIGETPSHVAVIQDGNRRYARATGDRPTAGHHAGAHTTEALLRWCRDLGIDELTLYAFSTENFDRPPAEREALFDLIAEKLRDFARADEVHENGVRISIIGDVERLPPHVQSAVEEATEATVGYDRFRLNVALAYGGRWELLQVAKAVCRDVEGGRCRPEDVTVEALESRLSEAPERAVDLIVRTGGDERTSNFLPWHANGNEAAVYFCTPYWPEFSKADFLRGLRTYEHRQRTWEHSNAQRVMALVRALRGEERPVKPRSGLARVRRLLANRL